VVTRKTFEETEVCPVSGGENRDASAWSEGAPATTTAMLLAGWSESEREGESPAGDSIGLGFLYPSRISNGGEADYIGERRMEDLPNLPHIRGVDVRCRRGHPAGFYPG